MHAALKKAAPLAALTFAALTLAGCVLEPAPYYGGGAYYAQPAPVYLGPGYYYGSRGYGYHRGWRGDGWHGGGHHWR